MRLGGEASEAAAHPRAAPPLWSVAPRIFEPEQRLLGADSLLLAQLLWNRGVGSAPQADAYLAPGDLSSLADPHLMRGVSEAVALLTRAIAERQLIAIHGDYDVDGVAGAALLASAVRAVGGEVVVHIPNRARDGYGVSPAAVQDLAARGARIIMTVDCGISANQEVQLAAELGIDVIVTDHHTVPAQLPAASAVLNPHQAGCDYPFKDLAGGGVAFQLVRALLLQALPRPEALARARELVWLAALSTVADVVPLIGENRTIVAAGLAEMRLSEHGGLLAICEAARRRPDRLSAQDLGFGLIPRLNAAGRMGDARDALDLLLCAETGEARELAARLESANGARRTTVGELLLEAEEEAYSESDERAIVLAGDYPIGVAGLIATRMAERYNVPCVVIERGEETSRGSARGVDGLNLVVALDRCAECLEQYGGHARAAGFRLRSDRVDAFRRAFITAVASLRPNVPERTIVADAQIRLSSVGPRLADLVERFEPVGAGNAPPTFVSRGVTLRRAEEMDGGHYRLRLAQGAAVVQGMAFKPPFPIPEPGVAVDVLYEVDRWIGQSEQRIGLLVRDLRAV